MTNPLADDQTGVLTIRASRDIGRFRARIRWTLDIEGGEEVVELCDSEEQVSAVVERWLAGLAPRSGESARYDP